MLLIEWKIYDYSIPWTNSWSLSSRGIKRLYPKNTNRIWHKKVSRFNCGSAFKIKDLYLLPSTWRIHQTAILYVISGERLNGNDLYLDVYITIHINIPLGRKSFVLIQPKENGNNFDHKQHHRTMNNGSPIKKIVHLKLASDLLMLTKPRSWSWIYFICPISFNWSK